MMFTTIDMFIIFATMDITNYKKPFIENRNTEY